MLPIANIHNLEEMKKWKKLLFAFLDKNEAVASRLIEKQNSRRSNTPVLENKGKINNIVIIIHYREFVFQKTNSVSVTIFHPYNMYMRCTKCVYVWMKVHKLTTFSIMAQKGIHKICAFYVVRKDILFAFISFPQLVSFASCSFRSVVMSVYSLSPTFSLDWNVRLCVAAE